MGWITKPQSGREDVIEIAKHASSVIQGKEDRFKFTETIDGVNVYDKKTKKTLSVNHTYGKGTYSKPKGKYYYEKAGRNKQGGPWSVVKVEDSRSRMYVSLKEFMSWFFG